jgi:threonine/homoserine/homoserine lactone efflux protein
MKPGLLIFTQIAIAGCGFLIYFIFALWRDSRRPRNAPKAEIRPVTTAATKGKVISLYIEEDTPVRRASSTAGI